MENEQEETKPIPLRGAAVSWAAFHLSRAINTSVFMAFPPSNAIKNHTTRPSLDKDQYNPSRTFLLILEESKLFLWGSKSALGHRPCGRCAFKENMAVALSRKNPVSSKHRTHEERYSQSTCLQGFDTHNP